MRKGINIHVDRLTNSIENSVTGEVFDTKVLLLKGSGKSSLRPAEWLFDWKSELARPGRHVYKLITASNPDVTHGLI